MIYHTNTKLLFIHSVSLLSYPRNKLSPSTNTQHVNTACAICWFFTHYMNLLKLEPKHCQHASELTQSFKHNRVTNKWNGFYFSMVTRSKPAHSMPHHRQVHPSRHPLIHLAIHLQAADLSRWEKITTGGTCLQIYSVSLHSVRFYFSSIFASVMYLSIRFKGTPRCMSS